MEINYEKLPCCIRACSWSCSCSRRGRTRTWAPGWACWPGAGERAPARSRTGSRTLACDLWPSSSHTSGRRRCCGGPQSTPSTPHSPPSSTQCQTGDSTSHSLYSFKTNFKTSCVWMSFLVRRKNLDLLDSKFSNLKIKTRKNIFWTLKVTEDGLNPNFFLAESFSTGSLYPESKKKGSKKISFFCYPSYEHGNSKRAYLRK